MHLISFKGFILARKIFVKPALEPWFRWIQPSQPPTQLWYLFKKLHLKIKVEFYQILVYLVIVEWNHLVLSWIIMVDGNLHGFDEVTRRSNIRWSRGSGKHKGPHFSIFETKFLPYYYPPQKTCTNLHVWILEGDFVHNDLFLKTFTK